MSPLLLVLLPTLDEGPMARAELSFARGAGRSGRELELLVEGTGARLRGQLADSVGLRVEAGCGSARCRLALDGPSAAVDAALPLLLAVPETPPPPLSLAQRQQSRRQWRGAWRRPSAVLEAAMHRLAGGPPAPLGQRLELKRAALSRQWSTGWQDDPRLVVAGDYSPEALTRALGGREVTRDRPAPVRTAAEGSSLPEAAAAGLPVLLIDVPGADRAVVAVVWATEAREAVRDQALAGDFQSRLVQTLRETHSLTYDVSLDTHDTWAAASWDVRPEAAWTSVTLALAELWEQGRQDGAAARTSAWRRLALGRALLADTLPGRVASSSLAPLPPPPAAPFEPPPVVGVAIVGDRETLTPEWQALSPQTLDACALLYGAECPPGS